MKAEDGPPGRKMCIESPVRFK